MGLENRFPDGDDVPGLDEEGGFVLAARHAFRVELQDPFARCIDPLDGDIRGIGDFRVAPGHSDRLEKSDLAHALDFVGPRLLDLPEDGKNPAGVCPDGEAHLRLLEVAVAVFGFDERSGVGNRFPGHGNGSDKCKTGHAVAGDPHNGVQLGFLENAEIQEVVRGKPVVAALRGRSLCKDGRRGGKETEDRQKSQNHAKRKSGWHFHNSKARSKLKRLSNQESSTTFDELARYS